MSQHIRPGLLRRLRSAGIAALLSVGIPLVLDGSDATVAAKGVGSSSPGVRVQLHGQPILSASSRTLPTVIAENATDQVVELTMDWSLQLNSNMIEETPPDPVLGFDHAGGCKSVVSIDGKNSGDSRLTDRNEFTAFETPWGKGYREAIVEIDLGQARSIRSLQWLAADANWIWYADLSSSLDGVSFTPVSELQHFEMHKKWGLNTFPSPVVLDAHHLRFRFYKDQESVNVIRLPASIMVFDGIENDTVNTPTAGQTVARGVVTQRVPAKGQAKLDIPLAEAIQPGSYLLEWTQRAAGSSHRMWQQILVKPANTVDTARTKRFGINGANPQYAELMAECGFGWVRFENGKWQMYCDAPNHFAFDGSIGPWHVNQDSIYQRYQSRGMSVLPYVFQTPEWANSAGAEIKQNRAGYPPKNPADYGQAVFQMVARYGSKRWAPDELRTSDKQSGLNRIQAVELWNEPNLVGPAWAAFVGPLEQYFEVMRAGVEGARRADPNLPVTSAGWAGTHLSVVDKMAQYRYADGKRPIDLVDIINVHFYSGREEPEVCRTDPNLRGNDSHFKDLVFSEQLEALATWRNEHNPKAKIWLTETGNDVGGPIGLSERKQAAKLPRVMMIALATGIDKVFLYRESGSDPSMHAGSGLLRNDGSLRPSWFTTATMIRELQGFLGKAIRLPHDDPNVWLLAWCDEERVVVAAWTIGEPRPLIRPFRGLLAQGELIKVVDAFGHTRDSAQDPENLQLELTEFPIYMHVRPTSTTAHMIRAKAKENVATP